MTDAAARGMLRAAAAHVIVDDVAAPVLDAAAAHHLFRVLRLRDGETVTVTDGRGNWRSCRAAGGELQLDGDAHAVPARAMPSTVAFAIPKLDRPEWVVQKLTELGVERIVLLHADRSVVRWDVDRAARHVARLRRVAVEALEQSRGVWLPDIVGPLPAAEVLPGMVVAEPGGRAPTTCDHAVAIGPEGGWSSDELELASDRVALTQTVLRVETAALVAGALMSCRQ
ncbi:MAG TPA: RsmE family RNA methyltransferase [Ilumatobacter sp.]|nr:RsmE family RNA methyltransferase [Ilumatobacter sp.]